MKNLRINHDEKGFTLIELMIVIAIIGILAAIAIPNYISFRDKAYCSGAEADANSILGTMADFYAIPANVDPFNGSLDKDGALTPTADTDVQAADITFKPLSNQNTATLATADGITTVVVTDVSDRCPDDYMDSQIDAGWITDASTFQKTM